PARGPPAVRQVAGRDDAGRILEPRRREVDTGPPAGGEPLMSRWLAVVCEAPADQRTACALADRVFCAEADWITEEVLDDYRRWRGHTEAHTHLTWREVAHLARAANIRVHGHFEGEPGAPDAQAARRALLLLKQCPGNLHGILLIRDDDRQTER